ncbi:hypothetical protein DENSPDRAFT_778964 [Dentipellis sp. KUC8613]|nr:hypothetical protein DENSPDRAFT_778964 [Dentipellis sp. KUC8613]
MSTSANPTRLEQAQGQAAHQEQCFHYLCAAVQHAYELRDGITGVPGALFPRQGLVFDAYKPYKLDPILGIKLHPRPDGTIHPGDIEVYQDTFKGNWKYVQGGVLYAMGEKREFWNCVLNWNSKAKTTGNGLWDSLFRKLKASGYKRDVIPCMFFNMPSGCLNPNCAFKHNTDKAVAARDHVLKKRRQVMNQPTPRQRQAHLLARNAREQALVPVSISPLEEQEGDDELVDNPLYDMRVKAYCANIACNRPWFADEANPLRACTRCKWAYYCSKECQTLDWPRHKREPCAPIEQIIENDELWDNLTRNGTGLMGA